MSMKRRAITTLSGFLPEFWGRQVRNPVFLVGIGRSGTTILAELLGGHQDIANWSELNDIWDPSGYPWHTSERETPPIWLDPEAYTARWWRDNASRQQEIKALFGAYQWMQRKPVFLNKTPLNTFRIPQLVAMFPEARFIHIVRDGRAVVASYARKETAKITAHAGAFSAIESAGSFDALAEQLAIFWKQNLLAVNAADEAGQLSARGKMLEVTYEDLCADKDAVLTCVCDFLSIDPARFSPAVREQAVVSQNHKWRQALSPNLVARVTAHMEPYLGQRGYV